MVFSRTLPVSVRSYTPGNIRNHLVMQGNVRIPFGRKQVIEY